MAALIELLLQGEICHRNLIRWLDGASVEGILEDLQPLRVEFVPVFLNFLRDQSSGVLQVGLPSGFTPNKAPSSVRATKYISPGKDPGFRNRARKQPLSSKAKTLHFSDTPVKTEPLLSVEEAKTPDLDQLLRLSNSALTVTLNNSPPHGRRQNFGSNCLTPNFSNTNKQHGWNSTSTPRNNGHPSSHRFESPLAQSQERPHKGKRQSLEGSDSWGKLGYSSEVKHSEQRSSLGDFITTDVKWANRRKSPLPREGSRSGGRPVRHQEVPKTLDISDREAFPMVGSTPTHDKQAKRRINPTRITTNSTRQAVKAIAFSQSSKAGFGSFQSPSSPFLTSEEGGTKTMEEERELLRQERMKRQETGGTSGGGGPAKPVGRDSPPHALSEKLDYVEASLDQVTNRSVVDVLVQTYAELILFNMAPSIMVELYYIVQLLTVRTLVSSEELSSQQREPCYLDTIHNCVYFATNVLLTVVELVKLLDKATIRFLAENPRVNMFSVDLQKSLGNFLESPPPAPVRNQAPKSPIGSVSFQSDTDNRNNFPNDQAFHIFRKQRDMFYEMIRIWEENHLMSGWSYGQALGAKIKQLLTLRPDPINFAHFARLFQSQLLTMCRGDDDQHISNEDADGLGFLTLLKKQQPEKYKRLYERLVTPSRLGGPCPSPSFPGSQEFFREFILTASNLTFNQHLKNALISRILNLNDQEFVILEPEEGDPIDNMVREEARSVVLNLRLLAKFLGFLEFLPYQTSEHLPENVMATQISLRAKVYPPININAALRQCMSSGRLVVGVTWVVEFLSMVDPVALHSQHYLTVVMTLIAIFKLLYIGGRQENAFACVLCQTQAAKKTLSPTNSLLLKLLLGWLFDQPNFPAGLFFTDVSEADIDRSEYSQNIQILNKNYCHFCISCLRLMLVPGAQRSDCVQEGMGISEGIERLSLCEVSPTKNFSPRKGMTGPLTKTPSKELSKGMSISPMKTPSKFMTITMLESPQTTPLKVNESDDVTERTVHLDLSDFVDHQMITICCPFICELKHLLSEFWLGVTSKKSTNSYRKITPLSASDKAPSGLTQKQLQMQLEDNFFHNNPSSVRKTTEFVIERVSSNVIKKIRSKIIPDLKENALEQLKSTIDERLKNSPQTLERTRDTVQKHVSELSQEMSHQIRAQCTQMAQQECQSEALSSLAFLMPPDMSKQSLDVCRKIVSRSCQEKVTAWVQSHLTPVLFSKDLAADGDRLLRQAQKAADFQATALQNSLNDTSISNLDTSEVSVNLTADNSYTGNHSGLSLSDYPLNSPTNHPNKLYVLPKKPVSVTETLPVIATEHDDSLPAPSKVITDIKEMVRVTVRRSDLEEESKPSTEDVCLMLQGIRGILTKRQDITLTVFRALESLTVDLALSLVACLPDVMSSKVQETFVLLWQPVDKNGVIPVPSGLTSSLSSRTVMLIGQNPNASDQRQSWIKLENLLAALLINKLLTPASLQEQCVALLRHSWPQEILTGMSSCIEGVSRQAQKNKDLRDDPTLIQLLEWVGWVCGQMEDFPDIL